MSQEKGYGENNDVVQNIYRESFKLKWEKCVLDTYMMLSKY